VNDLDIAATDVAPYAVLLDVGHGSAAVFIDGDEAIVVDAGSGDLVTDTLERNDVRTIAALIISHRHHDHTSEVPALLANKDLCVKRLFLNSDPTRVPSTKFEKLLRGAINDSWKRNKMEFNQVNVTLSGQMSTPRLKVEIMWPGVEAATVGVGASTEGGGEVHPHAVAVVLRVGQVDGRSVLIGSDLDHAGFRVLLDDPGIDLTADVLVYPHHGGLTGAGDKTREQEFARDLARATNPEIVVFSNGRERYRNPRPEVVKGIRDARESPRIRVVCTQLAKLCSSAAVEADGRLDPTLRSAGAANGISCSGSIRVELSDIGPVLPFGHKHMKFVIDTVGGSALCAPE
jgi:beta-lactamase superfamily II metal-dependent hydrolase